MIQSYVLLGALGVHSIEDIRQRKITITISLFFAMVGIFLHLMFQNQSIYQMLFGLLPGIAILALSSLTGGKIGMGDGVVIMLTGFYLGFYKNLMLLFLAFLLAGILGLYLLVVHRWSREGRMPFVPFLFASYLVMLFW